MSGATSQLINAGKKLHLQHGPIDLIVDADGEKTAQAYTIAKRRFDTILQELVDELPALRTKTNHLSGEFQGAVARRMWAAVQQFPQHLFTTPMICVAGSVADEVLQSITQEVVLPRLSVNNGGDIALHLQPGQQYEVGVVANPVTAEVVAKISLNDGSGVGGVATSGRHGRSFSLGIADAVTVLAADAATADTAATIIANAVSLGNCPAVEQTPAIALDPDTDLGATLVTTDVGHLTFKQINTALDSGLLVADDLQKRGLIVSAYLCLRQVYRTTDQQQTGWPHLQ